jgi:hypothetical protein
MGVVPGAGIGLGIDAAIRKKVVVYRARSGSPTKTSRTIASTVAHRQGVELSISF